MIVKLLTEHHLEFQSLKGGCRGLSESTHVKMPHCWKSHATAQLYFVWRGVSLVFREGYRPRDPIGTSLLILILSPLSRSGLKEPL